MQFLGDELASYFLLIKIEMQFLKNQKQLTMKCILFVYQLQILVFLRLICAVHCSLHIVSCSQFT